MLMVLDPYLGPPALARKKELTALLPDTSAEGEDHRGRLLDAAVAAVVCGGAIGYMTRSGLSSSMLPIAVVAAIVLVALVTLGVKEANKMRRLELEKDSIVVVEHQAAPRAAKAFKKLAQALTALADEQRAELRPLWDEAVKANKLLLEDPKNEAACKRIEARAVAVEKVVGAQQALEASEAKMLAAEKVRERQARSLEATDDDLLLAEQAAEALAEGQRAYDKLDS